MDIVFKTFNKTKKKKKIQNLKKYFLKFRRKLKTFLFSAKLAIWRSVYSRRPKQINLAPWHLRRKTQLRATCLIVFKLALRKAYSASVDSCLNVLSHLLNASFCYEIQTRISNLTRHHYKQLCFYTMLTIAWNTINWRFLCKTKPLIYEHGC